MLSRIGATGRISSRLPWRSRLTKNPVGMSVRSSRWILTEGGATVLVEVWAMSERASMAIDRAFREDPGLKDDFTLGPWRPFEGGHLSEAVGRPAATDLVVAV